MTIPLKQTLLCVFVFLLPWQTHLLVSTGMIGDVIHPFAEAKIFLTEIFVLLAALAVLWERPKIDASSRRVIVLAVLVFVSATLSLIANGATAHGLSMLDHLFVAMLFFTLLLDRDVHILPLLIAFCAGLVVPSLLGIWQVLFDSSFASTLLGLAHRDAQQLGDAVTIAADGTRQLRAYGSFSHPNIFGGYLAVAVFALWGSMKKEKGVRSWSASWRRNFALLLLLVVVLFFTASRSAILGLLLGIGLVQFVRFMSVKCRNGVVRARLLVVPIAIAVIGSALFISYAEPNVVASIRGGGITEDRSLDERKEQFADFPAVVAGHMMFGNGMGSYVLAAYSAKTCTGWDCQPMHNTLLLILAELGVVGLVVVIAWSSTIDRINFARFPNPDALVAFAMGNVILIILFFDHYIWSTWSGLALIAFVMALTVRMGEKQEKGSGLVITHFE